MNKNLNPLQIREWNDDKAEIWWREISGPKRFLKDIEKSIRDGECVLTNRADVDTTFIERLKTRFFNSDSSIVFMEKQAADFCSGADFENKIALEIRPRFTPGFVNPFKDMVEEGMLAHRIFIVLADEAKQPWIKEIINGFSAVSRPGNGVFLFLLNDADKMSELCSNCKSIVLSNYVSPYNIQYFALQCLTNFETDDSKGAYIAQLVSKLSLFQNGWAVSQLASPQIYGDDLMPFYKGKMGELAVLPKEKVKQYIWEAQIQVILPIIEQIRRYLIKKYEEEIQNILPREDEFGNKITIPAEMELRHLHYYLQKQKCNLFTTGDNRWFNVAYAARNNLSHLKILKTENMDEIFGIEVYLRKIVDACNE